MVDYFVEEYCQARLQTGSWWFSLFLNCWPFIQPMSELIVRFCNTSNSLINNLQLKRFKGMSIKNVTTKSNEFLNCMFGVIEKDMEMVDDCPPECYEQQL